MVVSIVCKLATVQESDFMDGIVELFGELHFAIWDVELREVESDEVGPVHLDSCQSSWRFPMRWCTNVLSSTLLVDGTLGAYARPGSGQSVLRWPCWI